MIRLGDISQQFLNCQIVRSIFIRIKINIENLLEYRDCYERVHLVITYKFCELC